MLIFPEKLLIFHNVRNAQKLTYLQNLSGIITIIIMMIKFD